MEHKKEKFLTKVASELLTTYQNHLPTSLILVPNKRTRTFLFEYMREMLDIPLVAPLCLSSEEYASYLSGIEKEERIPLLFQLYESYESIYRHVQKAPLRFEDFYFLGSTLLSDFDELDRHLIPIEEIYKSLTNLKSYEEGARTIAASFSSLWDNLKDIYAHFTKSCKKNKKAYTGLLYRLAVESPCEERLHSLVAKTHIFWVGFYALSPAEEKLFTANQQKAIVYLDMDTYITENDYQEAGFFYRKFWKKHLQDCQWNDSLLEKRDTSISILATTNETTMVKLLGEHLAKKKPITSRPDEVAIILPKEELLFPVLHVLPEELSSVNVTMGFPLRATQIATWLESLFRLRESMHINDNTDIVDTPSLSGQLLLHVLDHQYTRLLVNNNVLNDIILFIRDKNLTRVSKKLFREHDKINTFPDTLAKWLWEDTLTGEQCTSILFELTKSLLNAHHQKKLSFDTEFMYIALEQIDAVRRLTREKQPLLSFQALIRVIRDIIQQTVIAFSGEPLEGWQIMGVLETQALDFDTIYVLSMNEDIMPHTSTKTSFIPSDIRRIYHLPLPEETEAIYAYHFYRLLKRSREVFLFYTKETGESGEQEKSRYLEQILLEYLPQDKALHAEKSYTYPFTFKKNASIEFPKTEEIKQKLATLSYSPSALTTYFQCSLRFYYQYFLGIRETKKLEEDPDAATKGTIIHKVMENLFAKGKVFQTERDLLALLDETLLSTIIAEAIQTEFSSQVIWGRLALLQLLIKEQVKQIILEHKNHLPFAVVTTEVLLSTHLITPSQTFSLTGRIDRIDNREGSFIIIDYKTGGIQTLSFSSESLLQEEILHLHRNTHREHLFQLLFYAYLLKQSSSLPSSSLALAICSLKEGKILPVTLGKSQNKFPLVLTAEHYSAFEEGLSHAFTTIFSDEPFQQTMDDTLCSLCLFKEICNR